MKNQKMKSMLMLAAAALLLTLAVGSTLAYLLDTTETVSNTFTPAKVTCAVNEQDWDKSDKKTKTNVSITNTGNVYAYIRVAVVGNWYNAAGNIIAPHTVDLGTPDGWTKSGGYYYHTAPVAPGKDTSTLIDSYKPTRPEGVPTDAHFEMNIICQAIQAEGMGAASAVDAFAKAAQ